MSSRTTGDVPDPPPTSKGVELPDPVVTPDSAAAAKATASTAPHQTDGGLRLSNYQRVIVYKVKGKKKRKKKKYSDGLKDFQRLVEGVTDSSARLSRGLSSGVKRYRKASNRSARKKRDGIITDFLENWSKGAGRTFRVASEAPYDFSRRVNTKPYTRFVRSTVGFALSPFFR